MDPAILMDPTKWDVPFPIIVAALFVIVMGRANATYWLGRLGLAGLRHTKLTKLVNSPGYLRATERIDRYGAPVITLSFFTIGFQTLANLSAGATAMKLRHYLPAVSLGSVIWALLYATIGKAVYGVLGFLYGSSPFLAIAVFVLIACAIATYVVWQYRRRTAPAA
jgi:membrane protein DedA with SNARE-associated domain